MSSILDRLVEDYAHTSSVELKNSLTSFYVSFKIWSFSPADLLVMS